MLERIVIIGSQGAGKTTLAWQLSNFLGLPVVHLDRHFWQPGWKRIASEDRIATLKNLAQKEWWIIEGSYLNFIDIRYINLRFEAADTIIFLDTPSFICFIRMIVRHIRYGGKPRPDLPVGCTNRLTIGRLLMALAFPYRERKDLFSKFSEIKKASSKQVYLWFVSNKEASPKQVYRFRSKGDIARFFVSIIDEKRKPLPLVIATPSTQEDREADTCEPARGCVDQPQVDPHTLALAAGSNPYPL